MMRRSHVAHSDISKRTVDSIWCISETEDDNKDSCDMQTGREARWPLSMTLAQNEADA
ncbi:hypothetical protein KIN20_020734 [Parelaphostrongylus tenuis]|uniref:Uncharacterized protein n=1 Tax=Parelaphostrongylus tenuis TaxID=148309 RepID=A0AAD5N3I2_PARTN|nr:hypothetical protein KIN20_020734 [Parelaphostrongylus tenuis]